MAKILGRAVVMASLALILGGCNSFLGIKFTRGAAGEPLVRPSLAPERELAQAVETEAARSQLQAGLTASAIISFQQAMAKGEPMAPAANGLGVAFARLGRLDLARRYFELAKSIDPSDPRYTDNLARIEREELLLAAAATNVVSQRVLPTKQVASFEPGRIERLSRGEVRIVTGAGANNPKNVRKAGVDAEVMQAGRIERLSQREVKIATAVTTPSARGQVMTNFKPLVRISFVGE